MGKTFRAQYYTKPRIREETTIKLYLTPLGDVSVGRYETRTRSTSLSDNQPINAEDKSFTVQKIVAQANMLGTSIILFLIIADKWYSAPWH